MKLIFPILLSFSVVTTNCNQEEKNSSSETKAQDKTNVRVFDKLIGTWQMGDGKTYERWIQLGKDRYQSSVYTLNNNDTNWKEQAIIFPENDLWIFENTVKDQNNGKAIRFTSSFLDETSVQFSNTLHDFPQQIRYDLKDDQTLQAFIAGPGSKAGIDTIPFHYTRLK